MKKENKIFPAAVFLGLFTNFIFEQDAAFKISVLNAVVLVAAILAVNLTVMIQSGKENGWLSGEQAGTVYRCSLGYVLTVLAIQAVCMFRGLEYNNILYVRTGTIIFGGLLLAGFAFVALRHRKLDEDAVFYLLLCSFCVRVFYVVLNQGHIYQNDTVAFAPDAGGHLGYVYYIYSKGALPDFDPTSVYQYYHPPLHHMIAAVFARMNTFFGVSAGVMEENLQILPMIYTTLTLGYLNKTAILMKISCFGRFMAVGLAAFLPYGIIMAGSNNNDPLLTLFMMMAVYYTLKWYQKPELRTICAMGACIGCAMMTKTSGVLIAPAMALVMLVKAWQERKRWLDIGKQFLGFGLIAFPLGLWYPLKCLILYQVPLGYVPLLEAESDQYIGMYTGWQRIIGVDGLLNQLFLQWNNSEPNVDYNIPVSLLKFTVFGEGNFYQSNPLVRAIGTIVFVLTGIVFALIFIFTVVWLFQRSSRAVYKLFMVLIIAVIMASYISFCYKFPHICTMHVRYVMMALFAGLLCMGAGLSGIDGKLKEGSGMGAGIFRGIFLGFLGIYVFLSILMMINLEFLMK